MNLKSERLRKFDAELLDLQKWLDLGLVPKKDIDKHHEEINAVKHKIEEEKQRLLFMKESGDMQDYVAPKKSPTKQAYADPQTMPDIDVGMGSDAEEGDTFASDRSDTQEEATMVEGEDEEDPFSDKNRWKRGILEDPDADNW